MSDDVVFNESNSNLGVSARSLDGLAIVGPCSGSGLVAAQPVKLQRLEDILSAGVSGPLVSAACLIAQITGEPLILCKTNTTTDGAYGTVVKSISGTSDVTAHSATKPFDGFDVVVKFTNAITVGTAGGKYTYSLDGGLTTSPEQSLGTALYVELPGNVRFDLESGETLAAGDSFACRTTAPQADADDVTEALAALRTYNQPWELGLILGNITATIATAIEAQATTFFNDGEPKFFLTDYRRRGVSESRSTYLSAAGTEFASTVCGFTSIGIDVAKMLSAEKSYGSRLWRIKRQISIAIAARLLQIRPGKDPSHVRLGPLPSSIQITTTGGAIDDHDEALSPGFDDLRFTTLRTRRGRKGAYIKNCRVFSAPGSDFEFAPQRRVMSRAEIVTRSRLELCSGQDVLVSKKTGYIAEAEAQAIEHDVNAALDNELVKTGDCSDATWRANRDDNLLSTKTLNGKLQVIPKAYLKKIISSAGLYNPALNAVEE